MSIHPAIRPLTGMAWLMLALSLLIWHCDRHDPLLGTYQAVDDGARDRIPATIELHANGKGLWSVATESAAFRWDVRRGKIHLHTQSGGIIEGAVDNGTLRIEMPGSGPLLFERRR